MLGLPNGETDPELVLLAQAEAWAAQELRRQGTADNPLAMLLAVEAKPQLIRQRMEELRHAYLTEMSDETQRARTPHGDDRWCVDVTRALPGLAAAVHPYLR